MQCSAVRDCGAGGPGAVDKSEDVTGSAISGGEKRLRYRRSNDYSARTRGKKIFATWRGTRARIPRKDTPGFFFSGNLPLRPSAPSAGVRLVRSIAVSTAAVDPKPKGIFICDSADGQPLQRSAGRSVGRSAADVVGPLTSLITRNTTAIFAARTAAAPSRQSSSQLSPYRAAFLPFYTMRRWDTRARGGYARAHRHRSLNANNEIVIR